MDVVEVYFYEEMQAVAKMKGLSLDCLEEARRFSFARYDTYEGFDCVSLEMLDFENLLLSKGSVLLYLEKERVFLFTSQKERDRDCWRRSVKVQEKGCRENGCFTAFLKHK